MEYNKQLAYIEPGDEIQGFYILKSAVSRTGANGKLYLNATLSDATGTADAKLWDYSGNFDKEEGKIIKIRARADEYRGSLQLNIEKIRLAKEDDEYSLDDLVPVAPIDSFKELEYVQSLIETITDDDYRRICEKMLDRHIVNFGKLPAAKSVHHSFISGLLMHTANMMKIADFLSSNIYPNTVDRSLLLTGTLLHDFAKEKEYTVAETGLIKDLSTEGMLLGHLVMGSEEIGRIGQELSVPNEKIVLLQHMILSHHGQPEFGAAVRPCIAESELLSYIDMLDSRMEIYAETIGKMDKDAVSDKIFSLDKRIYNHS